MRADERGFTSMTELMMASAIAVIIAGAMFVAMRLADEQLETSDVRMTIQDSAREGLYKMIQEIRESAPSRITIGGGGTTIQFNVPDPNNPVTLPSYAVNWPGHVIQYARNNSSQVVRTNVTLNQTSIVARDVTALTFTGNVGQPTVVTIAMSVQRLLKNNRAIPTTALQITGQAKVRNP